MTWLGHISLLTFDESFAVRVPFALGIFVRTAFLCKALFAIGLLVRASAIEEVAKALGEFGFRLLFHGPAAISLYRITRVVKDGTPTALLRPVDVTTRGNVRSCHSKVALSNITNVGASGFHIVRCIPQTVDFDRLRRPSSACCSREWEAMNTTHCRVEVSCTAVKVRNQIVVITVDRADARKTFLSFILVLEGNPSRMNLRDEGNKRERKNTNPKLHCGVIYTLPKSFLAFKCSSGSSYQIIYDLIVDLQDDY